MSNFRVLIVEDDDDFQTGMIYLLKKLLPEIEFFGAENGLKAIKMIIENNYGFNLIVSDLLMPKITGYELVKYLNQNNIFIPLIALTGEETSDEILFKAGFSKVIRKSNNFHQVIEGLHSIILSHQESKRLLLTNPKKYIF